MKKRRRHTLLVLNTTIFMMIILQCSGLIMGIKHFGSITGIFFVVTLLLLICLFFLVNIYAKRITVLTKNVETVTPDEEPYLEKTGIYEIDELTSAITMINKSLVSNLNATSKILELSLLPIGGFEVKNSRSNVIVTDYIYFLLNKEKGENVSVEEWNDYYLKLTKNEFNEDKNIFHYYNEINKKNYWLRISVENSEEGSVGAILDVTDMVEEKNRLLKQIDFDHLTGLYTKTALNREAERMISLNPEKFGAMIFIDLDNLKYINDNFGHEFGDSLLTQASIIFKYFEKYNGLVSRISGDEFAVYIHGFDNKESLWEIIKGLYSYRDKFPMELSDGQSIRIRFSAGVAIYPDDAENISELIKLSDFAMYEAKHKEKGHLLSFDREYYKKTAYLLENREAINRLIDEKLIKFAFQPIVDLTTGEIFGYEALMRSMLDNFKNPHEILTVASTQSKLSQLERMVILKAYNTVDENIKKIKNRKIFINSIPHFTLSPKDEKFIHEHYKKYFGQIVIEIIEQESTDESILKNKVNFLREEGVSVAIDDFGNGYSNELRILSIMPDIIKLDMELIQGIHLNIDKQTIVSNIVEFCHRRNIKIVAEGIETREDLKSVTLMGVDYAQGYYLGRPSFDFEEIPIEIKKDFIYAENYG